VRREFIITNEQGNYELEMGIATNGRCRIILPASMIPTRTKS
jgi:hypothetical protein